MHTQFKDIIENAQTGDEQSFQEVYEATVDRIYFYVLSHTKNEEETDDITQEIFVDLWKSLGRFEYRSDEEFLGFLFKITKRKLSKRKTRRTVPLTDAHLADHYELPKEDHRALEECVESLSRSYRDVIRLRYWSGMSFAEIGHALQIKENAAKVRHHRALKQLEALSDRLTF